MKRTLPLLLIITAISIALAGCGTPRPGPGGSAAGGSGTPSPGTGGSGAAPRGGGGSAGAEGAVVKADSTAAVFRGSIATGRDTLRRRVRYSWRPGCPVGPVELRLLLVDYWGFDGRVHRGEQIVHRDHARRILVVFGKLFKARYPVQRLRLVDAYRADDDRSMAANNTSGFNCRRVSGSSSWSEHAFGRAIDLNPLRNPYVTRGGRVSPPAGRPYANRARRAAGMIHGGDTVVRAFAAAGWRWGGNWSGSRDYQHFSATGR
jgi:hypothetical protein